ncbi:Serine/threonine-protein kinase Nek10 [Fasciola gigantica]|uniref:Serine/threonine-protein kinase Nek10 n=1 Tax=Fasciola gigantica TaxID=46835 RepID=A0A504YWK6_FASGI|nr:Serine/threonine-protein kinase Nek10 [Fasciola gigantica]
MQLSLADRGHESQEYTLGRLATDWGNLLDKERVHVIKGLTACDLSKPPTRWIRDYAITELLGSGAFGQVYRARKQSPTQTFYAIKEVNTAQAMFGRTAEEREQSVGRILNEVNIIRHQMRHPNIVRYYKTFMHDERLYIVMEMLEGLSLTELIISLKDKREYFDESRIWHIFIQLIGALRYLHREKGILHRDLSANNIMIDEEDKVTITDFGLARQKQWDSSKMVSTVGTLVYSCPEIVQNIPCGEGVDIWALGCILYQICTYNLPFQAECILTVASRIVKGNYVPVGDVSPGRYSELIDKVIAVCLTPDPTHRPDIVDQSQSPEHACSSDMTRHGTRRIEKAPTIRISQTKLRPLEDPILGLVTVMQKFERLHRTPIVRDTNHHVLRQLVDSYRIRLFSAETSPLTIKYELLQLVKRTDSPVHCGLLPSNVELGGYGIQTSRPRLQEALEGLWTTQRCIFHVFKLCLSVTDFVKVDNS